MRSSRCLALTLVTALVIVVLAVAVKATAASPHIATQIAETEVLVWRCQDQRGTPRTPYSVSPWALPRSHAYRAWTLKLWQQRLKSCRAALHAHDSVIRRLQNGLSGTRMDGSAGPLEAIARKWGVSPYFIAAIAGTESSFGAAACSGNPFNAYGLSSCTTGWSVPYFKSWAESYEFMGRFLTSRWPSARTTYDFHGYAASSSSWGAKCAFWMRVKFGVGNTVSYPT